MEFKSGHKFREGAIERYRDAFTDLIANPGVYNAVEWTRKHRIGSQAVKSSMRLGVIKKVGRKLVCTRERMRVETIQAILRDKRRTDIEYGARRLGKTVESAKLFRVDDTPYKDKIILSEPGTLEVVKRRQVSILWGMFKWDL